MPIDYVKLKANRNSGIIGFWVGPTGAGTTLGITDVAQPLAIEINNDSSATGMIAAAPSVSWNDWDFGTQASETNSEPSIADSSNYEEFGTNNFGGTASFYYPGAYDDNSNTHSLVYDLTDQPGDTIDAVTRIDGNKVWSTPAANGDYVHVARAVVAGEQNPFTPGESKRRTVNFSRNGDFSHYTIVGAHTITAIAPATNPWQAGRKARLRASVQGREYTNALIFSTSNAAVVDIYPGGFYRVNGTAGQTATITITDPKANTTQTVAVTVTA